MTERLELPNVMDDLFAARTGEIAGAVVGRVESFDAATQTASIKPMVRRDGAELPVVPTVPVLFPLLYWDVQDGTYGILICTRENWRRWWRTGEISDPEDQAQHALTNGLFIPDLRTQGDPRTLPAGDAVLEPPTLAGDVLLGDSTATKKALHEDLTKDLDTFLTLLDTWGAAVGVATGVAWTGQPIQTAIQALIGGAYQSPNVKVHD